MITINRLARVGANGDPIAIPSIWSYASPLNKKLVSEMQNKNNSNNSVFETFKLGLR